jgi:hypothetical protein
MKEEPVKKSWTEGMNGDTPPRHLIQGHLQQQNQERLQEMADAGVHEVQVVGATDHECPACAALDGRTFAINEAPDLPPARCSCLPHCTCILTAIAGL